MQTIETNQLELIALDLESLHLLRQDRILLEKHLDIEFSDHQLSQDIKNDFKYELFNKINDVSENIEIYEWYTNWEIILKSQRQSIGSIGFSGYPDETGTAKIGFYIDERFRNRGHATEAIEAMVNWAFNSEQLIQIVAETLPENEPSNKLLAKCGFSFNNLIDGLNSWHLKRKNK